MPGTAVYTGPMVAPLHDDGSRVYLEPEPTTELPPEPNRALREGVWGPILRKVMDQPHIWFKIKAGRGGAVNATASNLRHRKVVVPDPDGPWEFLTRHDPDFPESEVKRRAIYARYGGEAVPNG